MVCTGTVGNSDGFQWDLHIVSIDDIDLIQPFPCHIALITHATGSLLGILTQHILKNSLKYIGES
jgi:hypothetical protein